MIAVNRFYAPDHSATAQLLTDLAEHLASHHQPVTVITSRLSYDDPNAGLPPRETLNSVTIRRVWTTRFGRAALWGRALDYASFYLSAFIALLIETRPGDTILAKTDPPLISLPAAVVARLRGARLVNWCQDVFPEIAASLGMRWAAGPIGKLLRRLRNWSLNRADCNVTLCDAMRDHLAAEGIPAHRLRIIHNWPDPAIRPLPRKRAPGEPFTICYSGNLGRAHNVEAIIELIRTTADLPLRWLFIGGGAGLAHLQAAATSLPEGRLRFAPYAPRGELAASLAQGDAHLVALDPACEGLIHPSKIYGILAAGRPAVFLGRRDGSVAAMLNESSGLVRVPEESVAGLTLDVAQPETWRPAIESLLADPAATERMGRAAHDAYQRRYTQAHSVASWREVLTPAEAVVTAKAEAKRAAA